MKYTKENLYIHEANLINIVNSSFISGIEFYMSGFTTEVFEVNVLMIRKNGDSNCYSYKDVTIVDLLSFLNSDSKGKGYNQYIKKYYKCTRIL